jgi:hypothetical protein
VCRVEKAQVRRGAILLSGVEKAQVRRGAILLSGVEKAQVRRGAILLSEGSRRCAELKRLK